MHLQPLYAVASATAERWRKICSAAEFVSPVRAAYRWKNQLYVISQVRAAALAPNHSRNSRKKPSPPTEELIRHARSNIHWVVPILPITLVG